MEWNDFLLPRTSATSSVHRAGTQWNQVVHINVYCLEFLVYFHTVCAVCVFQDWFVSQGTQLCVAARCFFSKCSKSVVMCSRSKPPSCAGSTLSASHHRLIPALSYSLYVQSYRHRLKELVTHFPLILYKKRWKRCSFNAHEYKRSNAWVTLSKCMYIYP